jgi:ABC-type Na+ efflux pump permease subunit
MNWKKILAVVRREYTERVRTKAFWVATLVIPFCFFLLIGVQIAFSQRAERTSNHPRVRMFVHHARSLGVAATMRPPPRSSSPR